MTLSVRKFPVSFGRHSGRGSDHVVPMERDGVWSLVRLDSQKATPRAFIAYIGVSITSQELIEAMRDVGLLLDTDPDPAERIDAYVRMIPDFKVGNVVAIEPSDEFPGLRLVKLANMPPSPPPTPGF